MGLNRSGIASSKLTFRQTEAERPTPRSRPTSSFQLGRAGAIVCEDRNASLYRLREDPTGTVGPRAPRLGSFPKLLAGHVAKRSRRAFKSAAGLRPRGVAIEKSGAQVGPDHPPCRLETIGVFVIRLLGIVARYAA